MHQTRVCDSCREDRYYTGTIFHSQAGKLETTHIGDLVGNAGRILGRMAENKAGVLVPGRMLFLWTLYVAATVSVVICAFRFRPRRQAGPER